MTDDLPMSPTTIKGSAGPKCGRTPSAGLPTGPAMRSKAP